MADPQGERAQALKEITSKRTKTDADHEEMARREWFGSLYLVDGKPVMPGRNIWSALGEGARKLKMGRMHLEGIVVDGIWPIEYIGPPDVMDLFGDKRFVHQAMIPSANSTARVKRTRPIFTDWSISFVVGFMKDITGLQEVYRIVETTGYRVGLGDWRPTFGRFAVSDME